jgi:crotonobetainyl-CoA:carnitine CoA-transferase CaiB-like acyl-CoA transferase
LYRLYKASEGWVFLAALTDREWQAFASTTGRTELASDPRFATADARREHDAELIAELSALFATRSADEWETALTAADVACVRADGDSGTFFEEHPHAVANNLAVETESPRFGKYKRHGGIVQFSDTPGRYGPGPFPGEHTVRLMEELGYDRAEVDALREQRVVDWEEVNRIAAAI